MVSLARRLIAERPSVVVLRNELLKQDVEAWQVLTPVSLLQQLKLLKSGLISDLDKCSGVTQVKQVHAQALRKGLGKCSFVFTKMIRVLAKFDVPMDTYPRSAFNQVRDANPFLWTALIRGYLIQGSVVEALVLYNSMLREGISPLSFTFSALLKACGEDFLRKLGSQLHAQIIKIGRFNLDLHVGNTLIDMYVNCQLLDCGRRVFDEMPTRDVLSWTNLIVAYAKVGDMVSAGKLFDQMPVKDMVAWTTMVTGFAQNAMPKESLLFFQRMQHASVGIDEVTLASVISACAQLGAANCANWVRDIAERLGYGAGENVVIGSALLDMCSKCGDVDGAYEIFRKMRQRNVYSYSSMISGFAIHGRGDKAVMLFEEMVKLGVKPSKVTFIGVLNACSRAGFVEKGMHLFGTMEECYGVKPSADHYTCMVDLLGRAGKLEEALQLIRNMPIEPHAGVWGALLGACRIHKNPDMAGVVAGNLFCLEPDQIGNYVLLANIYGSASMWEDVARIRRLIKEKGLRKNPSCSWVEGSDGIVHEFNADDNNHPLSVEIRKLLGDLLEKLKLCGYQPNLSSVPYDLNEDKKKQILMFHSEKLALAYALLALDSHCRITIMKNLRICEDCHSFICFVSKITGREIVVRDHQIFHHFRSGICSCRNFW